MNKQASRAKSLAVADDEIDLVELFQVLWRGRWIIAATTASALLLAIAFLNVATYRYTATLTLTPAQASDSSLTSKLGGLGDLASLAGINMPQDPTALAFSLYIEGVHSRSLADALVRHQHLMRIIFHRDWDATAGEWREPKTLVRVTTKMVKRLLGMPALTWGPPSGAQLQEFLDEEVSIEQDPKKPFAILSFDHEDPAFAARFVSALNAELDNMLRQKALIRANGNIAYLSRELSRVTIAEHREALAQALSEQEQLKMAASSSAPYAADPFGNATVSLRPTSPSPLIVLLATLASGLALGVIATIVAAGLASRRHPSTRDGSS